MRRLIISLFCVFLTLPLLSQNTLTVHQKNGQKFGFGFEEKPIVSFTDNFLIIKSTKAEVQYELVKVAKVTFDDVNDAVIGIKADDTKTSIALDEYYVSILGSKADITVLLLTSDGKQLQSYKTNTDGSVTFSIAELPEGIYIITSESRTVKILKK